MASIFSSLFGSKPTVPNLPALNLQTEASKAIAGNQANLPAAEALTSSANAFTQQQINSMLEQAIPGYSNLVSSTTGDIQSMVSGQLPADVKAQIQQSTAASAVAGGYSGSGMAGNLTARDLGLTSLNLMQQGISTAESWMQEMNNLFSPGMMNVQSMFVSPSQQASFDVEERNAQFQRQWMQNQISAMPDPTVTGIWNASWSVLDAALSAETGQSVDLGRVNPSGNYTGVTSGVGGGGGGGFGGGGGGGGSGAGGVSWIGDYGAGGSD